MFAVMAFVTPNPGMEAEIISRMQSFRTALQSQSGLVKTFMLKERDGKTLVGISMWTDEAAYDNAMAKIQTPIDSTPPERLRLNPPLMREFFEI